jgi:CBS domain-containing protein
MWAMTREFQTYQSIKEWRDEQISHYCSDTYRLNTFHDIIMRKVYELAVTRLKKEKGTPPCPFTWFITGSGGRFEQGIISDQDHGIIYATSEEHCREFFKSLGEELSYGLNVTGYPYCEGNVMSSNPLWCKSLEQWKEQLLGWMKEASFQTIRNLQIFFDARLLVGAPELLAALKTFIFDYQKENPSLTKRLMENVMHIKSAIGPLGQMIVEEKGAHAGAIDLKHSAFLPYVNAIRLLAMKEQITETSTLGRIDQLMKHHDYKEELADYKENFLRLLQFRLSLFNTENSYDDIHYLNIKKLTREEKKEMKHILKAGKKLHHYVIAIITKDC